MIWTRGLRVLGVVGVLALVAAGPAGARQSELEQYYASTKDICRTGVTPEIVAAYEQARREMDRARAAGTLGANNFAGVKMPQEIVLDCFQSPGDGKF